MARPKIGVLLAGCGVYDGAEIHEAVITLLALDRAGVEVVCIAPNMPQLHVVNHVTGAASAEVRNVLIESARISRGAVKDVASVAAADLDALIIPGGFGAAKNLCDFAVTGAACTAHPEVARLLRALHADGKPIGAVCIAPALVARVLGADRPRVTIGNDAGTAAAIEAMGAHHTACRVDDIVIDHEHRLVTTPAYMLAGRISEAAAGIEKLVGAVLAMVGAQVPTAR